MMSGRRGRVVVAAMLAAMGLELSAGAGTLFAQRVYRWTDERGTVHFSDSPPPPGANVEVKDLPRKPPPARAAEVSGDEPSPNAHAGPAAEPTPKRAGAAKVQILDQDQAHAGDAVYEFSGKVENTGGKTAEDVVVNITVTEPNQGARCVSEQVEVDPPTLQPGEKGSYFVSLENPCFHGPISAQVEPDWH